MDDKIGQELVDNAIYRFDESTRMIEISLDLLTEEELWKKPNGSSNSIANLILHLCGNITQYIIASLGETTDEREREKEFTTVSGHTKKALLEKLKATVEKAKMVMWTASESQLLEKRKVQGFYFSGVGVIVHAVEHYSYHTGQIALWTKLLKNKDLGFYDGMDLTIKNKE